MFDRAVLAYQITLGLNGAVCLLGSTQTCKVIRIKDNTIRNIGKVLESLEYIDNYLIVIEMISYRIYLSISRAIERTCSQGD